MRQTSPDDKLAISVTAIWARGATFLSRWVSIPLYFKAHDETVSNSGSGRGGVFGGDGWFLWRGRVEMGCRARPGRCHHRNVDGSAIVATHRDGDRLGNLSRPRNHQSHPGEVHGKGAGRGVAPL